MTESKPKGPAADETASAKSAQDTAATTEAVINTDPTDVPAPEGDGIQTAGVGENAVVIGRDDIVSDDVFGEAQGDALVELKKDIVEEFYYPGTKRPAYRILFTAGQVVRRSQVEAYNTSTEQAKDARDGKVDEDNVAGIDSTTLASGTRSKTADVKDAAKAGK